ncbi:hypothetical protein SAMN05421870_1026 [Streptomyces qinglanensis]|uniref:Uncharacterized protein n=1 Tax=Streptomyces qinglanensis TaxID=943816 RepID=A0A1H9PGV6_9ACTN|nr:hypothetical protein SAMN05421870_1026 [Streptomyces qinglanensis]
MSRNLRSLIVSTHPFPHQALKHQSCTAPPQPASFRRHRSGSATPKRAYHCEAAAYAPATGRSFALGTCSAPTPRLALRWLLHRAGHIADQLDTPAAKPVLHWLGDQAEHEHALSLLTRGETYTFTVFDDTTRYALSARATRSAQ